VKLETNRVSGKQPARQPRPLDRALALLDVLLARAALVVLYFAACGYDTT
jgi:hypothetical protein